MLQPLLTFSLLALGHARTIQFYIEPTQKVVPTYVQQLVEGNIEKLQQGSRMRASVSLIYDGGYYILVDTPSATDVRAKEAMLRGIASRNIVPGEVQMVVTSHGHPDHFGQDNFFPNARHFFGSYEYSDDVFISTELKNNSSMQLSRNVDLWSTPGHTSQDLSVIVRNVPCCGTVAVVGDLFYNEQDAINGTEWYADAWNPLVGKLNRDRVLCSADYIIPGHGKLFKITDEMRTNAACGVPMPDDINEITGDYGFKRDQSTMSFTFEPVPTTTPATTTTTRRTTTTAAAATTTTTTTTVPSTTPFVTVDQYPELLKTSPPEIKKLYNSVNDALPYVVNNVLTPAAAQIQNSMRNAEERKENIIGPVVETAAKQLSRWLKVETPSNENSQYPFTSYWQQAFNKLANDIPDLQKALNSPAANNIREQLRAHRHPSVDSFFRMFNPAFLNAGTRPRQTK